jgi:hypothetical protein
MAATASVTLAFGWGDPFFGGFPDVTSYTYFTSFWTCRSTAPTAASACSRAAPRPGSTSDSLPQLVPNLVEAMFTAFPGRSGEECGSPSRPTIARDDPRPSPPQLKPCTRYAQPRGEHGGTPVPAYPFQLTDQQPHVGVDLRRPAGAASRPA